MQLVFGHAFICIALSYIGTVVSAPVTNVSNRTCESVVRDLVKNPPPNTKVYLRQPVRKYVHARYRCVKGAIMANGRTSATRKCKNGKIIGKKVECKRIFCGKPNPIPHAHFNGTTFTYQSKVRYTCDKGYKLEGRSWRTCKRNGKWTKKPKCVELRCKISKSVRIRHGTINTTDPEYKIGATLLFTCDNGYELDGDGVAIECLGKKWSSYMLPYCKPIACPDPSKHHTNGRFNGRNFRVGQSVKFFCNSGLKLIGSKKRTCLPNKLWSGSTTVCDDGNSHCPNPGAPISGKRIGNRYNLGSIVRFKCDHGYVLVGSPVRQCLPSRKWNGTEAICMEEFEYMVRDSNNTAVILKKNIDKMVEYTCSGLNKTCNMTDVDMRARAINPKHAGGLDLVFVFDASSSIKKGDFKLGLQFAQKLVELLGTTWKPGGTHVAALTYGTNPHMEFNLGDASVDTAKKVIKKIGEIQRSGGGTASRPALDVVRKVIAPLTREESQKVLFFITDGHSNIGGSPKKAAAHLRKKENFEIYAVGVGKKVKRRELMSIASEPENEHVISVRKYKELVEAVKRAVDIKIDYSPCGESPANFRARMVGGNEAGRGTWPWQVGLHKYDSTGNLKLICGGALIDKQWVLTAAHCFYGYNVITERRGPLIIPPEQYTIIIGDYHLKVKEPAQEEMQAAFIFLHPSYRDSPHFENDIALVKLPKDVKLGAFVRTICLPNKDDNLLQPGKHGIVAGWGATQVLKIGQDPSKDRANSDILLHSAFTIQSNSTCKKSTKEYFNPNVTFCAGDGRGGNDTCKGDSGGSFIREVPRDGRHRWVTTGLVSWGEGCGLKDKYGFYTRVDAFVDWIKKTMEENKK